MKAVVYPGCGQKIMITQLKEECSASLTVYHKHTTHEMWRDAVLNGTVNRDAT